jgi:hypothetical protein
MQPNQLKLHVYNVSAQQQSENNKTALS